MAWTFLGAASGLNGTGNFNSIGSDLIIHGVGYSNPDTANDSLSNVYSIGTSIDNVMAARFLYKINPTVGNPHSLSYAVPTATVGAAWFAGGFSEYTDFTEGAGNGQISVQTELMTPLVDGCLIVIMLTMEGIVSGLSIDSGFTICTSIPGASGVRGIAIAYQIQTIATPINPMWLWTGAANVATVMGIFGPLGDIKTIEGHNVTIATPPIALKSAYGIPLSQIKTYEGFDIR